MFPAVLLTSIAAITGNNHPRYYHPGRGQTSHTSICRVNFVENQKNPAHLNVFTVLIVWFWTYYIKIQLSSFECILKVKCL